MAGSVVVDEQEVSRVELRVLLEVSGRCLPDEVTPDQLSAASLDEHETLRAINRHCSEKRDVGAFRL